MGHRKNPVMNTIAPPSVSEVARLLHLGKDPNEIAAILKCTPRQVRRAGKRFCERNHVSPLEAFGRVL